MSNAVTTLENKEKLLDLEVKSFELEQRRATALSKSAFFPNSLRGDVASAVICYDLANRMNISVLEVAQSVFIIHGKPSFETKFLVARLNDSGKIRGGLNTVIADDKKSAYCRAIDAQTGEEKIGMTYTMAIANAEGLVQKNGSKWQTMPELMLRYRAQSAFINEFYPEVKFGCKSTDEMEDIIETDIQTKTVDLNKIETAPAEKTTIDLNEIAKDEPLDIDVEVEKVAPDFKGELTKILISKKAKPGAARSKVLELTDQQAEAYLNDIGALDTLLEELQSE